MRTIDDLEHFVLVEGETLILRCTRMFSQDELQYMRSLIDRFLPGRPVLVLPPDIEVCAGKLEVFGGEVVIEEEDAEAGRRNAIEFAYSDGKVIWVRDGDGQVFMAQLFLNPHTFDWCKYVYGFTEKDVRS